MYEQNIEVTNKTSLFFPLDKRNASYDYRDNELEETMMKKICDILLITAGVSLLMGIIVRLTLSTFLLGITSQAYLQFSQALLLFAIAIGIRELWADKAK